MIHECNWEFVQERTDERGFREKQYKCTVCFEDKIIRENAYSDHP